MLRKYTCSSAFLLVTLISSGALSNAALAAKVKVAVASNFASTAGALVEQYSTLSNDQVVLLVGSTGKHTAQIQYGLPVDIFLAADAARPKLLEDSGVVVNGSRQTYAVGRLALWSKDPFMVDPNGRVLSSSKFKRLAIANPKTAPYGLAASQVLSNLQLQPSLVYGESVAQAFQFAYSGGAELAMLAFSQVKDLPEGSSWLVPSELHSPIEQQLVLVNNIEPARKFVDFLLSDRALHIIELHGYERPEDTQVGPR